MAVSNARIAVGRGLRAGGWLAQRSFWPLLATVALAGLVLLALAAVAPARELRVPLENKRVAGVLLGGFHELERDGRGAYRWTTGAASVSLALPGQGQATVLRLQLGPAPLATASPLVLALGDTPLAQLTPASQPRNYHLLVPQSGLSADRLDLRFATAPTVLPPDTRPLGVRIEGLGLRVIGGALLVPPLAPALLQTLTLALVALAAARLGAPGPAALALVLVVAGLLALAQHAQALVAPLYLRRLALAAMLLAALGVGGLALLEQRSWFGGPAQTRALWAAVLLGCAVRLAGALFPPFGAYDLGLNLGRLAATVTGTLVATNESFEFGGGVTVYPSGPYLALMPGLLAGLTPKLAVQGGIALLDGLAALGVAALGQVLGLRGRAVLLATLAYAALPIGLTTLYYGHTAQAFGQALMAPLAAALLLGMRGAGWRAWTAAGVLLAMALLSHIGVSILALAWLGLAWLALTLRRRLPWATWQRLTLALVLGGLAGLVFVYGPVLLTHLDELRTRDFGGEGVAPKPSYNLIAKAFWIAYTPLGLLLAVGAMPLLRRVKAPLGAAELLGAWAAAVALFWAVEMLSGLQVRYLVFLAPLVCLLVGTGLAWLLGQGRLGGALACGLVAALLLWGAADWFVGVFGGAAPSMVPLLRYS